MEIKEHLRPLRDMEVDLVLPTKPQDEVLWKLFSDLSGLDKVTLDLQKEEITMKDSPDFESAIVKVDDGANDIDYSNLSIFERGKKRQK
ncbi:unnamed protein product, partial [Aphanomyces euteiches]